MCHGQSDDRQGSARENIFRVSTRSASVSGPDNATLLQGLESHVTILLSIYLAARFNLCTVLLHYVKLNGIHR